jgi:hypothetical protein
MAFPAPTTTTTPPTSTLSPTAAIPSLAFTTPFTQPTSCFSFLTTTVRYYGPSDSVTFLLPNTSDPLYTACVAPASQFSFSPAVCPQGWAAWWIGQTSTTISGAATAPYSVDSKAYVSTTAYCCAPGYSMLNQDFQDDPSPSCSQAFVSTTSPSGAPFVSKTTLSVAMLPAWHISWQTTDIATLSPQPPMLYGHERITRWVPGSDPEWERREGVGGGMSSDLFYFLIIGVPLLVLALICAPCVICCRTRFATRGSRSRRGRGVRERSDPTSAATSAAT